MTQTTTPTEPPGIDIPPHPSDMLMNLIVTLLAPLFLGASAGDVRFARLAAIETVNAYRAQNQADLISVAQIIAFGLTALGSLSLSMADDLSLTMTLRLRGNANALHRSAEQNRRALGQPRPVTEPAKSPSPKTEPSASTQENPTEAKPAATPAVPDHQRRAMWAAAAAKVAAEYTASLPALPPEQRRAATIRAAALNSCAQDLLCDTAHPKPPCQHPRQPSLQNNRLRQPPA